jgi:5-formyltetrahydrofolate cyclo-ligase
MEAGHKTRLSGLGPNLQARKTLLRQEVRARVGAVSEQSRNDASERACTLLEHQPGWHAAASVLLYAPIDTELNVWPLLENRMKAGKIVALPQFEPRTKTYLACQITDLVKDVAPGRYGIREPRAGCALIPLNQLDFILVPGVAFDLHGHRLGRGEGFYDRLLATVRGTTCGVAFDEQIVREVPVEPHDSDVNCILTPTRWIEL